MLALTGHGGSNPPLSAIKTRSADVEEPTSFPGNLLQQGYFPLQVGDHVCPGSPFHQRAGQSRLYQAAREAHHDCDPEVQEWKTGYFGKRSPRDLNEDNLKD